MAGLTMAGKANCAEQAGFIAGGELTVGFDVLDGYLVPDMGPLPPKLDIGQNVFLIRGRLQNQVGHPAVEMVFRHFANDNSSLDLDDYRAGLVLPLAGTSTTFIKLVSLVQDPAGKETARAFSGYLMGETAGFQYAAGADSLDRGDEDNALYSLRLKRRTGNLTLMAGLSKEEDSYNRYGGGLTAYLPGQFLTGLQLVDWDGKLGYAVNVGRYTERNPWTDPTFSVNYLEIPGRYKWTTFRIMWGRPGSNYVQPTFENPLFSGQHDMDLALLLNELMPDNYRHFDAPLLYRRLDEYGRYTLRLNHINVAGGITRFEANLSYAPDWDLGPLYRPHLTLSFYRQSIPPFGTQPDRWSLDLGTYIREDFYAGLALVLDFEGYEQAIAEMRYSFPF
jgi:hypothetical protein